MKLHCSGPQGSKPSVILSFEYKGSLVQVLTVKLLFEILCVESCFYGSTSQSVLFFVCCVMSLKKLLFFGFDSYVITPYNEYPLLLGLLLKLLNGELAWSTRREVLKVYL